MRLAAVTTFLGAVVLLAGCATPAAPGAAPVEPLDVPVLGQGTVIQVGDSAPELCLGAVAESYPPQCSGPELVGWEFPADSFESANDVTWGSYAVWGDWDGTALTVTSSVMLALFDPMPVVDPFTDPANAGTTDEADLLAIQERIGDESPAQVLTSYPQNGYLFVTVEYDDGAVQEWADATYGTDVVQVRSALAPVEG